MMQDHVAEPITRITPVIDKTIDQLFASTNKYGVPSASCAKLVDIRHCFDE
jgi:hypothetical protein